MNSLPIVNNTAVPLSGDDWADHIDCEKMTQRPVNTGFQAAWHVNPDGVTKGPKWLLVRCGIDCPCSAGCARCLILAQIAYDRLHGIPLQKVAALPENLGEPSKVEKPSNFFMAPEGDLFHENISDSFIHDALDEVERNRRHNYTLITKRVERLGLLQGRDLSNVVVGVSVESQEFMYRAEALLKLPEIFKRAVFAAPMIGGLDFTEEVLNNVDWFVCTPERGGEGRPARPCEDDWVFKLRDQVKAHGVPFYLDVTYTEEAVHRFGKWMELPSFLLNF